MANTGAVKDPKNGVISCWVCTGVLVVANLMRLFMLRMNNRMVDGIFLALILIWLGISVYETVKYNKEKTEKGKGNER
mgnify:FL=1